jgi:hypothetical protein
VHGKKRVGQEKNRKDILAKKRNTKDSSISRPSILLGAASYHIKNPSQQQHQHQQQQQHQPPSYFFL